jgi:hypothetical protein
VVLNVFCNTEGNRLYSRYINAQSSARLLAGKQCKHNILDSIFNL